MMSKSGPPLCEDIGMLAKAPVARAAERMVWASNRPHPLPSRTRPPDDALLLDWAPDGSTRNRILADNSAEIYLS